MDEKPKNIWKKPLKPSLFMTWLVLLGVTMAIYLIILLAAGNPFRSQPDLIKTLVASLFAATVLFVFWLFVRWLCCWRNLKRAVFSLAFLATLIALFYAEENWRGWRTWENFRHEWEAKGERFDLASVVPPAVPDEKNFARTPVVASSYEWLLDKNGRKLAKPDTNLVNRLDIDLADDYGHSVEGDGSWAKGTLTDLKPRLELFAAKTNLFPVLPRSPSPAADVLLVLAKFDPIVEELREAAVLPESRFPLEYDKDCPAEILLPHLAPLKRSSQLLELRAIAELQSGDSQKALADVRLTLRLSDSVKNEPILISHLVRIAILQIALQPIYEGLAEHRWSDAQLVELDALLARENFLADYRTAMRGEMILLQIGDIQYLRRHPEQIGNLGGVFEDGKTSEPKLPGELIAHLIPSGWFYQNQYRCVRMTVQFFLPTVDMGKGVVLPAAVRAANRELEAEVKSTTPYNLLEKMLLPALGNAVKKFAYAQSAADLARTAIALERYRLAQGKYPATLDALAPQFIAAVPHDVIGGEPLQYRQETDGGFVLYSVGWNETDDGGVVVFSKGKTSTVDISGGDWVWRYPAK